MALISSTSPHTTVSNNTGAFMRQVIYATLPGLAALVWQFGLGSLLNVLWAVLVAVVQLVVHRVMVDQETLEVLAVSQDQTQRPVAQKTMVRV